MSKTGVFITFEGGDGSGKSTHIRYLEETLREQGRDVLVVREPGGTHIGEMIRAILLDPDNHEMTPEAELLLYEAARSQIVKECIRPALQAGAVVICDRFFDSTTAYQGFGRGLDKKIVATLNEYVTGGIVPDRTLLMDVDAPSGHERATSRESDRLENEGVAFQEKVREGFLALARREPDRIRVIDTKLPKSQVRELVRQNLEGLGLFLEDAHGDPKGDR